MGILDFRWQTIAHLLGSRRSGQGQNGGRLLSRVVHKAERAIVHTGKGVGTTSLKLGAKAELESAVVVGNVERLAHHFGLDKVGLGRGKDQGVVGSLDGRGHFHVFQLETRLVESLGVGVKGGGFQNLHVDRGEFLVDTGHGNLDVHGLAVGNFVGVFFGRTEFRRTGDFQKFDGAVLGVGKVGKSRSTKVLAQVLFELDVSVARLDRLELGNGELLESAASTREVAVPVVGVTGACGYTKSVTLSSCR